MAEDDSSTNYPFGEIHSVSRDGIRGVAGGAAGGGFHGLLDQADRDRGFLTENDRLYLLKANWDNEVSDQAERNARLRIRNRVLSTFFDARFLRYISETDREIIFKNARDEGYDLHFREGLKELVRFTYLGLYEFDIDVKHIFEEAIREAEHDRAVRDGEDLEFEVNVEVTRRGSGDVDELKSRYENHDVLYRRDLATLVNSSDTDIELADALYYDARQIKSDRVGYSWEDPDEEKAREIMSWLRSFFEEYEIETFDEYDIALDRMRTVDEELGEELNRKVNRLTRVAPNFEEQLAEEAGLSTSDMALLHDILWNPENEDVETALEKEVRPRTVGDEWDPAEDDNLQKFIARVQVAREANSRFTSGGEDGRRRWSKVLELANFDEEEWEDYMQTQRAKRSEEHVRTLLESSEQLSGEKMLELLDALEEGSAVELADVQLFQERGDITEDEIEEMEMAPALRMLLPEDADLEPLETMMFSFGYDEEKTAEILRDLLEDGSL